MRVVVTGYNGFIGRALVEKILNRCWSVTAIGRRKPGNLQVLYIESDLVDGRKLNEIEWGAYDCVVHLASAGVKAAHRFWPECLATNIVGMQRLLSALSKSKAKPKLFWAGTFYEKLINDNPVLWDNPYVATKWAASESFKAWCEVYSVDATLAYFYQVYGPGDDSGNVLSYIKKSLLSGEVAKLGSGSGLRDWIYIDDVTDAICAIIERPVNFSFKTVDIGSGELHSIKEAAEIIADSLGVSQNLLDFDSKRDRHDKGIELAANLNGSIWRPKASFQSSIKLFSKL
jgi:UDP-glucose 4-epimerase